MINYKISISFLICLIPILGISQQTGRCLVFQDEEPVVFETWLNDSKSNTGSLLDRVDFNIPMIFHIIHNGDVLNSVGNTSAESIYAQIATLNEDFNKKLGSNGYNDHPDGGA